jgi:hypothetical protein
MGSTILFSSETVEAENCSNPMNAILFAAIFQETHRWFLRCEVPWYRYQLFETLTLVKDQLPTTQPNKPNNMEASPFKALLPEFSVEINESIIHFLAYNLYHEQVSCLVSMLQEYLVLIDLIPSGHVHGDSDAPTQSFRWQGDHNIELNILSWIDLFHSLPYPPPKSLCQFLLIKLKIVTSHKIVGCFSKIPFANVCNIWFVVQIGEQTINFVSHINVYVNSYIILLFSLFKINSHEGLEMIMHQLDDIFEHTPYVYTKITKKKNHHHFKNCVHVIVFYRALKTWGEFRLVFVSQIVVSLLRDKVRDAWSCHFTPPT